MMVKERRMAGESVAIEKTPLKSTRGRRRRRRRVYTQYRRLSPRIQAAAVQPKQVAVLSPVRVQRPLIKKSSTKHLMIPNDEMFTTANDQVSLEASQEHTSSDFEGEEAINEVTDADLYRQTEGYFCKYCDQFFVTDLLFVEHCLKHMRERLFLCSECNQTFKNTYILMKHQRAHYAEDVMLCVYCDQSFTDEEELNDHLQIHPSYAPFQCSACQKRFRRRCVYMYHRLEHMAIDFVSCAFCKVIFNDQFTMECHVAEIHPELIKKGGQFFCKYCLVWLPNENLFTQHCYKHIGTQMFSCTICNETFQHKQFFLQHLKKHAKFPLFLCRFCDLHFSSSLFLQSHLETHVGSKPFFCILCTRKFKLKCHLMFHKLSHTSREAFCCNQCDVAFPNHTDLVTHFHDTGHRQIFCGHCAKFFASKSELQTHVLYHSTHKIACSTASETTAPFDMTKLYRLDVNNSMIDKVDKKGIIVGTESESLQPDSNETEIESLDKVETYESFEKVDPFVFQCIQCTRKFEKRNELQTHILTHAGKPFSCPYCSLAFLNDVRLNKHILSSHEEDAKAEHGVNTICSTCHINFFIPQALVIHQLVQTVPPIKCNLCSDIVCTPQDLVEHKRWHQALKIFCLKCECLFKSKEKYTPNLDDHKHTPSYPCPYCALIFSFSYVLKRHLKLKHPDCYQESPYENNTKQTKSDSIALRIMEEKPEEIEIAMKPKFKPNILKSVLKRNINSSAAQKSSSGTSFNVTCTNDSELKSNKVKRVKKIEPIEDNLYGKPVILNNQPVVIKREPTDDMKDGYQVALNGTGNNAVFINKLLQEKADRVDSIGYTKQDGKTIMVIKVNMSPEELVNSTLDNKEANNLPKTESSASSYNNKQFPTLVAVTDRAEPIICVPDIIGEVPVDHDSNGQLQELNMHFDGMNMINYIPNESHDDKNDMETHVNSDETVHIVKSLNDIDSNPDWLEENQSELVIQDCFSVSDAQVDFDIRELWKNSEDECEGNSVPEEWVKITDNALEITSNNDKTFSGEPVDDNELEEKTRTLLIKILGEDICRNLGLLNNGVIPTLQEILKVSDIKSSHEDEKQNKLILSRILTVLFSNMIESNLHINILDNDSDSVDNLISDMLYILENSDISIEAN